MFPFTAQPFLHRGEPQGLPIVLSLFYGIFVQKNTMFMIQSKLPQTGSSIFAVMSKLAHDYQAINVSQGFPNFDPDTRLTDLFHHYQLNGCNQYSPMPGLPLLKQRIAEKTTFLYGSVYDPDTEITITAGATQALYTAISTVVHTGDEVIILEPAYDSYGPTVILNGGIPVYIPLQEPDFSIDWEAVAAACNNRTRMIIINSPHNPTGALITELDIRRLEELAGKYEFVVLSDEVYEHIVFDDRKHLSIGASEILRPRTMVISSFGKTYHTTGWKVGYVCAPAVITAEFRKLHQFTVFCVNTPAQYAYADHLQNRDPYLTLHTFYQKKRDYFNRLIEGSPYKLKPAEGTYFQLLDYSAVSSLHDQEFSELLVKEAGVAVIPLSPFYAKGSDSKLIRICFAKTDDILQKAAEKLVQFASR